jgi:hypothetical protein
VNLPRDPPVVFLFSSIADNDFMISDGDKDTYFSVEHQENGIVFANVN